MVEFSFSVSVSPFYSSSLSLFALCFRQVSLFVILPVPAFLSFGPLIVFLLVLVGGWRLVLGSACCSVSVFPQMAVLLGLLPFSCLSLVLVVCGFLPFYLLTACAAFKY